MSYFLQPKRVKYRITLAIVGSLLEVTTSPTSPELTIAVIGIVVLGIQTLRGQLKWEVALVIVTGVIILFKDPEIINMVAGTPTDADKCV
ncbi:TrbC/VirB2 family protein [Candidatus Tisiphia endosymbiont of Sialis lutaria]|uniref:TrbC/VirB2 family protein n=1 Tax=Candidatus Tisiphia endosymbiont of Sialis lutaria TaxID=2029164 RepID=UPI00397758FB